jgi:ribonuclease VapC
MFVDACAIVSIIAGEDTAAAYETALSRADAAFTSPLAAWEAIIVLSRPD